MQTRLYNIALSVFLLGVLCVGEACGAQDDKVLELDELSARIQRREQGVTDQDMARVLTAARDLGRPFTAEAAVKSYMLSRPEFPANLLLMAAENALLAGDFRVSVSRYKNYLVQAAPGRESSDAAAMMLLILVDFLNAEEEAYTFIKDDGSKFCQSDNARKFDVWFLDMAVRKNDVSTLVARLIDVFSEKMSIEREKFFYWDYLDRIMSAISKPAAAHHSLLPDLNRLMPMVRADGELLSKYTFIIANLEFNASSMGKTQQEQEKLFESVVSAAKTYFNAAPNAATLQDIQNIFSSGFVPAVWQVCQKQKQDFFVEAFGKLSEADRVAIIKWMPQNARYLAAPEQWTQLCLAHPKSFAEAEQFIYPQTSIDVYKKQSPYLKDKASVYAAVVNAVAIGNDLEGMALHLLEKESWHLGLKDCYDLINNQLWPIFRSYSEANGNQLPQDYYSKFMVKFGEEQLLKSPLPLVDTNAAANLLVSQWEHGNKADMNKSLQSLNWISYTEDERKAVFGRSYDLFKKWVDQVRTVIEVRSLAKERVGVYERAQAIRQAAESAMKSAETKSQAAAKAASAPGADDAAKEAASLATDELRKASDAWREADKQSAQAAGAASDAKEILEKHKDAPDVSMADVSAIEEAFQAALNPSAFNIEQAPNQLCRKLATLLASAGNKNKAEYEKAARELYSEFKDFDVKKTPYGFSVVEFIMKNRLNAFDTLDFQLEVLADQLARWAPTAPTQAVHLVRNSMIAGRPGWPAAVPADDRANAQKVINVMEEALLLHFNKQQFWPVLFDWFRTARSGRGWRDDDSGLTVLGRLIQEKTFLPLSYRLHGNTAATTYMWLVQNEFIKLRGEYPIGSYFDDIYLEECLSSGELDFTYWNYGTDNSGKIVNMAMGKLQAYTTLPYSYKTFGGTNELWRWHNQCLSMNAAWRKTRNVDETTRDELIGMLAGSQGKTRFDEFARGAWYFSSDASSATPADRKELFRRLSAYVTNSASIPDRVGPPNMNVAGNIKNPTIDEALVLISFFPELTPARWAAGQGYEQLPALVTEGLLSKEKYSDLIRVVPYFWKIARDLKTPALFRELASQATLMLERELHDLAAKYSVSGLEIAASALPEDARITLTGNRMKALVNVGDTIPVDRHDPRYPIFAAQTAFLSGNVQNAWELYLTRPDQVGGMFKELDPEFSIWLIRMNTESQSYERADDLARGMMQWLDALPEGFDRNLQARVMIAYADIAFNRQEFPRARALYQRIVADKAFIETRAKYDAEFRIVDLDRVTKSYDAAILRLETLSRERERWIQTQSCYMLALIKFEQQDYIETGRLLDYLFILEPGHVPGKLLEGKLNLELKRYESASNINVGLSSAQRMVVPGRALSIHIEDPNLAVARNSTEIQVRIWTDSGDDEFISLLISGQSKTRFEGSIPTEMAPMAKGDRVLQLLGNDVVYYDYSDAFKKSHGITESDPMSLNVASDAVLLVSSGAIVSEEEQQEQGFRRMMDQVRRAEDLADVLADGERTYSTVRPGNQIYVRVVDHDRSVTPDLDNITVKISAYSGDAIPEFVLSEIKPYSGIFEGAIRTTRAGAVTYATDSSEGSLPFYAISSGAFPPWVAFSDGVKPKSFSVDLNNNVLLGKMNILADVAGRKLKDFYVQISFDNKNFTTVGSWPEKYTPWDGTPGFEFVSVTNLDAFSSAELIRQYIETDSVGSQAARMFVPLTKMLDGKDPNVVVFNLDNVPFKTGAYVARFRAAFHVPHRQNRMFKLDRVSGAQRFNWFIMLNGEGPERGAGNVVRRLLQRGVHFLDVYIAAQVQDKASFQLSMDTEAPPYAVVSPMSMFDPVANPAIRANLPNRAASVTANKADTSFDVDFASDTRGRVIRLVMADFETDAPAIRKISLVSQDGDKILPIAIERAAVVNKDFIELVAGDRVSIIYEDPKVVTEGKEVQERFMTANYHDGDIYAAVYVPPISPRAKGGYVEMFRFVPGEKIDVLIKDPDLDVSDQKDVITFTAKTELGDQAVFKALETEEHSGVFIGSVFTVTREPTRPDEMQVEQGESIILSYQDEENTNPGIPWARTYTVEQVTYDPPELRVYDVTSFPLDAARIAAIRSRTDIRLMNRQEHILPTRDMVATRPLRADLSVPAKIIAEGPLLVELSYPSAALSTNSSVMIYAQTMAARKAAGLSAEDAFDPAIMGTVVVTGFPSEFGLVSPPPGYLSVLVRGDPYASAPLRDGRFSFNIKKEFGSIDGDTDLFGLDSFGVSVSAGDQPTLFINSSDDIFIAFKYTDSTGKTNWMNQRVELTSDIFMDVMDRYYQETVDSVFVGQPLYLRVNHRSADVSEEKDVINVSVKTAEGVSTNLVLMETFEHSGSFRGVLRPVYFENEQALTDVGVVPVKYGDSITVTYQPSDSDELRTAVVDIHKGADGEAIPFTKQFANPETAVQTQFMIAEAYFELAKKHRAMDQTSLARRQLAQGRRLLDEVIRDYPNIEIRAQADYLLADLALEYANDAVDDRIKREQYLEAINLFTGVIMTYPDSLYAPRSQYKKGLAFEKLGDLDRACEEYVKLSYLYPDNELVAETIARLGTYFSNKGKELQEQAEQTDKKDEAAAFLAQSRAMFKTAAEVFSRLAPRFPTHDLAGKTLMLSGQCYMRANEFNMATRVFGQAIRDYQNEHEIVAEAMYWRGDAFMKQRSLEDAYKEFKKLSWDYPATKWAKFARGRLTAPEMDRFSEDTYLKRH